METLNNTEWDVIINGTGISQSLLALALSRSNQKILHVDRNDYYGGSEAAFSLQEAQAWVNDVNEGSNTTSFENASITIPDTNSDEDASRPKLSFPRAYSIALAPQLIYTDSILLSTLVKAKVHEQVEFLPIGAWWIYKQKDGYGSLIKVPTNREDIAFSDAGLDLRSKRALVRVIRFVAEYENQMEVWQPYATRPFSSFLREHLKLPADLHGLLLSLALTPFVPEQTLTTMALPRIAQHLRSTGRLGPGFSAVTPRWGGLSEVCQVACRAAAVGGTVYALKQTLQSVEQSGSETDALQAAQAYKLDIGDEVRATVLVTGPEETSQSKAKSSLTQLASLSRSITIVGSSLSALFPEMPSGSPPSAGTIVAFPTGSLPPDDDVTAVPPVYLIVHNHHTGECPRGQCVIYASTSLKGPKGFEHLNHAVGALLALVTEQGDSAPRLWSMRYEQSCNMRDDENDAPEAGSQTGASASSIVLPSMALDLVFDDSILEPVERAWEALSGSSTEESQFMTFAPRTEETD